MRRVVELTAVGIAVAGCAQILGFESPTLDEPAGPSTGGAGGVGASAGPGASGVGPGGAGGGAGNMGNVGNMGNGGDQGGAGGGGAVGGGATEIALPVASTANDAVWNQTNSAPDEMLFDGAEDLYVSTDSFDSTAGFRFQLPIPAGATILSATLEVTTGDGDLDGSQTIQIQVWDSVDVPPFDGAHTHHPMAHDPAGLWDDTSVDGFAPLPITTATSPNLNELVQHIVDRPDYEPNDWIGFALFPGAGMGVGRWITLLDYVSGTPAVLHVVYVE